MEKYRKDFGIYRNNKELVYLDHAATTFMPDQVINVWMNYQQNVGVSINRGDGFLSKKAQEEYNLSKEKILDFFDARETYEMAFGKNATECLNLLAFTIGRQLKHGDIILMSPYEHHSNSLPWNQVAKQTGACVVQFPLLESGEVDYKFVDSLDIKRIKVISTSLVSNVNAHALNILVLKEIISKCDAYSIIDVSQAAGHRKLSFSDISADAYVMSAHKMYGPKNIGAAVIKYEIIEQMPPFILGGGMVWNSLGGLPTWHEGARKFEAGTIDVGLIKAWSEACSYLDMIGMRNIMLSDKEIWNYTEEIVRQNGRITVVPGGCDYASICSFEVNGIHPHDVAEIMAQNNIEIRTGHMCAQGTLDNFGITSLCRISWGIGSSKKDIDRFMHLLEGAM